MRYIFKNLLGKKFSFCQILFLNEMQLNEYNEKLHFVFKFQDSQHYYHNILYYKRNKNLKTQKMCN